VSENFSQVKKTALLAIRQLLCWELDEALRRRRFEKRIYIPLPTIEGRKELFRINLKGTELSEDMLSEMTGGYSGADIANVSRDAAMASVRKVMENARQQGLNGTAMLKYLSDNKEVFHDAVTQGDFLVALWKVGKSVGTGDLEKYKTWFQEFGSS